MPELRRDPIIGRWVIIATERAKRPDNFGYYPYEEQEKNECIFCEGNESKTPPEIYALRKQGTKPNTPGWDVRVIQSQKPFLSSKGNIDRRGKGVYDIVNGIGAHEVVIETPKHISHIADLSYEHIAKIINVYINRFKELEKDQRFKYVLLFKNHGVIAGSTSKVKHCRSKLIATPVNLMRVKEELFGAKKYFEYRERCIFCDMLRQELESGERIVMENETFVVLTPFASRFPFEMTVLPKQHSCDFDKMDQKIINGLANTLKVALGKLKNTLNDPAFNFMLHTAPFRRVNAAKKGYWSTVDYDFHWHIEIVPRLTRVAGFEWGSGFYMNPTTPEEAAKYLREAKNEG